LKELKKRRPPVTTNAKKLQKENYDKQKIMITCKDVYDSLNDFFELRKKFESSPIEELEETILAHWNAKQEVDEELKDLMSIRKWKINDTFEWTPENKEKFLRLNQKFINHFEKLRDEAVPIIKMLQKRIEDKDEFLHDFYLEVKITPYIYVPDENGAICEAEDGMERILDEILNEHLVPNIWGIEKEEDITESIYFDTKQNWNIETYFEGKFDGDFISQAIHDLYDHSPVFDKKKC